MLKFLTILQLLAKLAVTSSNTSEGWILAEENTMIDFNLENEPLEVKTESFYFQLYFYTSIGICVSGASFCEHGCIEENDIYGTYYWPSTKPAKEANMNCFYNEEMDVQNAYKKCDEKTGKFEETDFGNCKSKVYKKILHILDEAEKISSVKSQKIVSENMKVIAQNFSASMMTEDVNNVAEILNLIVKFREEDEQLNIKVRSNVMEILDSVQNFTSSEEIAKKNASRRMRNAAENLANRISLESNDSIYLKKETLTVVVIPPAGESTSFSISGDISNLTNSEFFSKDRGKDTLFSVKVPGHLNSTVTAVIYNSKNFYPESETVQDVTTAVTKQWWSQGKLDNPISKVVSLIADINYANITEIYNFEQGKVIELNFTVDDVQPEVSHKLALNSKYECAFYNNDKKVWVTGHEFGSTTNIEVKGRKKKRVNCKCSHMASFAVLMSFDSDYNPLEGTVTSVLLKSSLGCLILTILAYLPAKEMRKTRPVKINLLLVTSLMLSILVFFQMEPLTSVDVEKNKMPLDKDIASLPCTIVASLMNYFWLCQMAWMVCEAVVMYRTLVSDVFNSYISRYMVKFNLACWVIPLIFPLIGIVWGQSNLANPETCFLRKQYGLVIFYAPVTFCILFNTYIFIRLSWSILWKNKKENDGLPTREEQKIKKQLKFAVTVMTMFGVGWILGFFLIIKEINTIWLRWFFIICNSSQGIIIFYIYVLQNKDLLKKWKRFLNISRFCSSIQPGTQIQVLQSTDTGKTTRSEGFGMKSTARKPEGFTTTSHEKIFVTRTTKVMVSEE
ncbi:hypothetical protein ACHWQZ_G000853 [Mnemiopsis leidyi]